MMSISKVCDFDFQRMARTRGGMSESQNRSIGRGRARGRGRVLGVHSEEVRRIERADVSARSQMPIRESSPSSASVGNERSDRPNVRAVSHQGSSMSAASALIFEVCLVG